MHNRLFAKISGYSLIIMGIIAAYTFGYIYPMFQTSLKENLSNTIFENRFNYKLMLSGILIIIIIDLILSYTLYIYFKIVNKNLALISAILRFGYSFIFIIATSYLFKNNHPDYQTNDLIAYNFQQFDFIWSNGLIVFGMHLFLLGTLMSLHEKIPKTFWIFTLIGAVSYILIHLSIIVFGKNEYIINLEMILMLPMIISEIGLAYWLICKDY